MKTFDQHTIDSSGAFLVGELERLDKTLHLPLAAVSWNRDIDLRQDVSIADESSSYTNTSFAAAGGVNPVGKNWIAGTATEIPGIAVDINKTPKPLRLWGMQLAWSLIELAAAEQVGRPIDAQKYEGLKLKHNMDVDEMVYIGDTAVNAKGLVNAPAVPVESIAAEWTNASTPVQMLQDVNDILEQCWKNSAYAVCPARLMLPPRKFSMLTRPVSEAGSTSLLKYICEQCISNAINGKPLEILPLKWLTGRGVGNKDRVMAYSKEERLVRYPLVPLQHTPVEHRGLHQITTYFGRLGEIELVYPETILYADGI